MKIKIFIISHKVEHITVNIILSARQKSSIESKDFPYLFVVLEVNFECLLNL